MDIQRTFHNDYLLTRVSVITAFPSGFFMHSLTDTHCGPLSHRKSILFCCWKLHCRFPHSVWGDFPSTSRRCWCVSLKATEKQNNNTDNLRSDAWRCLMIPSESLYCCVSAVKPVMSGRGCAGGRHCRVVEPWKVFPVAGQQGEARSHWPPTGELKDDANVSVSKKILGLFPVRGLSAVWILQFPPTV